MVCEIEVPIRRAGLIERFDLRGVREQQLEEHLLIPGLPASGMDDVCRIGKVLAHFRDIKS